METIGEYSKKKYKCRICGTEKLIGTNHWGCCYSWFGYNHCPYCSLSEPTIWDCQEPVPEGYEKPEEWEIVRLEVIR